MRPCIDCVALLFICGYSQCVHSSLELFDAPAMGLAGLATSRVLRDLSADLSDSPVLAGAHSDDTIACDSLAVAVALLAVSDCGGVYKLQLSNATFVRSRGKCIHAVYIWLK